MAKAGVRKSNQSQRISKSELHQETIILVTEFIKEQLHWEPPQSNTQYARITKNEQLYIYSRGDLRNEILAALKSLANGLQAFTENILNEPYFPRIASLFDDFHHPEEAHDAFNTIADELFAEGIGWSHIVTLLVFGQELAYNCIQNDNEDMVQLITEWVSNYINVKLSDWIEDQNEGWIDIITFANERITIKDNNKNNKSLKILCGFAATAALLSIAILCSKLHA